MICIANADAAGFRHCSRTFLSIRVLFASCYLFARSNWDPSVCETSLESLLDCRFIMNDSLLNHFSLKKIHEHRQWLASPSTEIGDSGVASRLTPSSSTSDHQLNIHSSDANHEENDRRFSTLNGDSSLYTPVPIEKRRITTGMIVWLLFRQLLAQLRYKRGTENMHYSHCLVTFLDHASAIFIQIPTDGRAFQQMHQDMKWVGARLRLSLSSQWDVSSQYYMDRLNECDTIRTSWFHVGDFCVAYSTRYCEYFRARILNIDHQSKYTDVCHSLPTIVFQCRSTMFGRIRWLR